MDQIDDVILYLLPRTYNGAPGTQRAMESPENKSRFIAARPKSTQQSAPRQGRSESDLAEEHPSPKTGCLVLRFSDGARTRLGVVGGCADNVDLSFRGFTEISKHHIAFTFDEQNVPIVRDLGSIRGTKVTYNGEMGRRRSNFSWSLIGPSITKGKPPILSLAKDVQFKVVVPRRDLTCPDYIRRVKEFREGTADPHDLLSSLILQSIQATQPPTERRTPSRGSSTDELYTQKVGEGNYGVVTYVWSPVTREEYVVKTPLQKDIDRNEVDVESWENEASIMEKISHKHVVALRGKSFSPYPKLEFEYIAGGSLDKYNDLSTRENTQILYQLSSALEDLHNRNPSICHRDIKPENILVVKRDADGIFVKFGDFGLSKAADLLKTWCGTPIFQAPELYQKAADPHGTADDTYDAAVDIWSLGLTVASLECGLPAYKRNRQPSGWIQAVWDHVTSHERQNDLLRLVKKSMLVIDPKDRDSADYVNDEAKRLLERFEATSDAFGE